MRRHNDPLTYKHPRTTTEAFGCDHMGGYAVYHHRRRRPYPEWLLCAAVIGWTAFNLIGALA